MRLQLQCAFCDKSFTDFGPLGAHVRTEHPEIGRMLQRLETSAMATSDVPGEADTGVGLQNIPTDTSWEEHGWFQDEESMLPAAGEPKQDRQGGGRKSAGRGGGSGNSSRLPFLNSDMLSTTPKDAKILMVRFEPQHRFGPSVVVKLAFEGKSVLWTLHINNNPNFGILSHEFGRDENDWLGKKILLGLEQDEFTEDYLIRATFPEGKKGK